MRRLQEETVRVAMAFMRSVTDGRTMRQEELADAADTATFICSRENPSAVAIATATPIVPQVPEV